MAETKIIFVTGTDTGVGKTLLTGLLLHHLREGGVRALAMKPFCSGGLGDVRLLQSLQPGELTNREMNPFYFAQPIAPLVAQIKTRRAVQFRDVLSKIKAVAQKCDCLLIEGSGGLLVPLGPGFMVADLIAALNCRVIVASRNRLGTINHTLLTAGTLRTIGINPRRLSVVLMGQKSPDISARTNSATLTELLKPVPVCKIPFLGARILNRLGINRSHLRARMVLQTLSKRVGAA
jgi:dethiobiotin synthetase